MKRSRPKRSLQAARALEKRARENLRAQGGIKRGKRPRAKNPERKARLFQEQYGGPDGTHHHFVREQGCVVGGLCWGPIEASHYPGKGAGGKWHDLHGMCMRHHRWLHDWGPRTFQRHYNIDLPAENRRLVVEHYGSAA